jgi:hypothetical protein
MAAQSQNLSDNPDKAEASGFDLLRQEARDEVRRLFAAMGLSPDALTALGFNGAALQEPDDEE